MLVNDFKSLGPYADQFIRFISFCLEISINGAIIGAVLGDDEYRHIYFECDKDEDLFNDLL